ncbi:MAG: type II toxin-antitoxin system prevent-host-death family antitoxin [Rhodocyclaceae bacterium]|jgi:antitoxin (DNA-binding transcriptional repressor) of toxin-antitoxin stability system|nr:type II toxin-antitoxin system prevent-host-death family antitoxin [Rhodocyclaceae bacterium]MBK6907359.1 type II toxin-antitoxin system prevent-host-death family antitoxin [Rhodocyclaceae bacterium]
MLVNMLEAKNNLSSLAATEREEGVILVRDGKPVAKIVPFTPAKVQPPGGWKGLVVASPDWDSPESNAEIAAMLEESAQRPL